MKYKHDCSYAEQKRILNSQLKLNGVIVGFALDVLESLETRLMKHQNRVPFGSSIIIVIKKCFVLDAIQKKAKHGDRL